MGVVKEHWFFFNHFFKHFNLFTIGFLLKLNLTINCFSGKVIGVEYVPRAAASVTGMPPSYSYVPEPSAASVVFCLPPHAENRGAFKYFGLERQRCSESWRKVTLHPLLEFAIGTLLYLSSPLLDISMVLSLVE